jgi:integrase
MLAGMWKMKSDLKKAGIPYKENGRYADFHALRHTLGTNLSSRNVPPRVAMELMRHSDIRLELLYRYEPPAAFRCNCQAADIHHRNEHTNTPANFRRLQSD